MAAPHFENKLYDVRSGTTDLGREYEYNMTALLCARCIAQNVEDMWIVSNCDKVGALDDVILNIRRPEGNNATFMIQLKHKAKPTKISKQELVPFKDPEAEKLPKGDFFLEKYLKDIKELKKKIETGMGGVVADVGAFSDIQFVIFTNRDVFAYDFLESARPSALLNTNNAKVYKFDFGKLSLLDPFFTTISDCGTNLFLYPKQLNVTAAAKGIVDEIKNIFGALGVKLVNAENIGREFMLYVTSWAKGDLGKHYYLTKREVVGKLYELFFRQFEVNLSLKHFTYYTCPTKLIWNEVISDQDLVLVDDLTLQFLLDYIGSEVRKMCNQVQLNNWRDAIVEADKNSFYQSGSEELKRQFLKVVGKHKTVNGVDVYRTMVMMKKIPLLVKINNFEEYKSILRVHPVSDFKIILINFAGSLNQPGNIKSFGTLPDLPQESKSKILELPVKLQGRSTILRELVNEKICKLIKCNDVINILLGNFNIGNKFPELPPYFVKRSIAKVLIDSKILQRNLDDIILIQDNEGDLSALKFEEIDFKGAKGAIRAVGLEYITRQQKQHIMESAGKNVHYFKVYDEHHLEWKWSLGSIEFLKTFRIQTLLEDFNDELDDYLNNNLNIVSAPPGMGKTFLMDCLAHEACRNSWVLRINLNASNHREYYSNTNHNNSLMHLCFFNKNQLNENKSNIALAQAVFENLMHEKKIITIFDGFDEISNTSIDQVTRIAMTLYHDGFPLWITTRPQGAAHLQSKFNTFVLNLKPFDLSDRLFFLRGYFRDLNPEFDFDNTSLLDEFINQLLEAARNNLEQRDATFTGIPLQLKMLAEVFNDNCVRYVNHSGVRVKFTEDFDLLSLYEEFINKKMKIVCDKFGWRTADLVSEFKHHQGLLAFKFLHPYQCLEGSYIQEQLGDSLSKNRESLQMDGIMTLDGKGNINCVHKTFAEYLVVQFILKNLKNPDERLGEFIKYIICTGQFVPEPNIFLLEMFDRMVVKESSLALRFLYLAIRKRDSTKIKDIIEKDPSVLKEEDASGRSFLHLLALNAATFPVPYDINYVPLQTYKSDGFEDILEEIPKTALTLEKDLLGFTPLDYAISNVSLHIAKVLSDVASTTCTANPFILVNSIYEFGLLCLKYSLQLNAEILYSILVPCFAMWQLFDYYGKTAHTATYRFPVISATNKFEVTEASVVELLQTEFGCRYSGYANGCYSNLFVAIVLGSEANVHTILNSNRTCINQTVCQWYTPLSLAAFHGKVEVIDDLLSFRAKINMQDYFGYTALSYAIRGLIRLKIKDQVTEQPYLDIIRKLIRSGINVNTQLPVVRDTCLHLLLKNEAGSILSEVKEKTTLQLLQLFIDNGADVNIRNRYGYTPLHVAAQNMLDQSVKYLLYKGADVNAVDANGNSALCLVIQKGNKLIFVEGMRFLYNVSYKPIHRWVNNQKEAIASIFLKKGVNVNHPNNNGQTAWMMALPYSKSPGCKDLEVLSKYDADDSIESYGGSLPLYFNNETVNDLAVISLQIHDEFISRNGDSIWRDQNDTDLFSIVAPIVKYSLRMSSLFLRKDDDTDIKNRRGEKNLEVIQTGSKDGEVPVNAALLRTDDDTDIKNRRGEKNLEVIQTGSKDGEVPVSAALLRTDDDTDMKNRRGEKELEVIQTGSKDGEVPVNAALLRTDDDTDIKNRRGEKNLEVIQTGSKDGEVPVNAELLRKDDDVDIIMCKLKIALLLLRMGILDRAVHVNALSLRNDDDTTIKVGRVKREIKLKNTFGSGTKDVVPWRIIFWGVLFTLFLISCFNRDVTLFMFGILGALVIFRYSM